LFPILSEIRARAGMQMEQETLFTAAKWSVLKSLSFEKMSPLELAEENKTSMSNISQALRFLELAGLVKSERISNRDKGQPRVIYSIAKDNAYLILTAKSFVDKKMIEIDEHKKTILKIWFYENGSMHFFLEKAFENVESKLDSILGIFIDKNSLTEIKLLIVLKDTNAKLDVKDFSVKNNGISKKISYKTATKESVKKDRELLYPLYDPQNLIEDKNT
jgi:DNA-binding transcriptional regulator GbsR (MarR family)